MLPPLFVVVATRGLVSSNATVLGVQRARGRGSASAVLGALMFGGGVLVTPLMALGGEGTARADGGGGRRWRGRGPGGHGVPYTTAVTVSAEDFGRDRGARSREFVRDAVVPREREIADTNAVPDDLRAQAAEMGLFGYAIPEEYGGLGLDLTQDVELALELGYTSLAFRSLFGTNNGIAGQVLVGYGTDAQKKRWLEAMAEGRVVASFALTEPEAGSDPSGMRSTAHADGDGWIINGAEAVHHQRPHRRTFRGVRQGRTGRRREPGMAVFLVPADTPGGHGRAARTTRWARRARPRPTSPSTTCGSTRTPWSAARCAPASAPP